MDFWRFWAATQVYIIHKVTPRTELSLMLTRHAKAYSSSGSVVQLKIGRLR